MSTLPPTDPSMAAGPPREAPGATAGLVFGILSLVLGMPILGLVFAIIGMKKCGEAKRVVEVNPAAYSNAGVAQAGWVVSLVGLILGIISTLCGCGYFIMIAGALGFAASNSGTP